MKFNSSIMVLLKKIFILLFLLLVIDFAAGAVLKYFFYRQKSGLDYQTIYSMQKSREDILFFGSSRASHHYVPAVFSDKFNLSAYNTGRDGNFILYGYSVAKSILARHTPKLAVIDISRKEFQRKEGGYDYLSSLLPFYDDHTDIRDILNQRSRFERVKLISRIYPYNSLFPVIALNVMRDKSKSANINGFIPLTRSIDRPVKTIEAEPAYELDPLLIDTFRQYLKVFKEKGIPVAVVCSPYYDKYLIQDATIATVNEICKQEAVPFLDYSQDTRFTGHQTKFDDFHHLNEEAAREFSKVCSDSLKNILF